jgi:hypothetical protein
MTKADPKDNDQLKTNPALQICCDGAAARRVESAKIEFKVI